jgi:hypothetical protein
MCHHVIKRNCHPLIAGKGPAMLSRSVISAVFMAAGLAAAATQSLAIDEIADRYMYSKGGILYPHTGDSSQALFKTPPNAKTLFPPGTLVGVLPADCTPASNGSIGSFYRCNNDFALREEVLQDGRTVYQVIENP